MGGSPTSKGTIRSPIKEYSASKRSAAKRSFAKNTSLRMSSASAHIPMMDTNYAGYEPIEENASQEASAKKPKM